LPGHILSGPFAGRGYFFMWTSYIDEAGDLATPPDHTCDIQPVFAMVTLAVDVGALHKLTLGWIDLKKRFLPRAAKRPHRDLDWMLVEIKGSTVRRRTTESTVKRQWAFGVVDATLRLVEQHTVGCYGRVYVKGIGQPINHRAVYTSSIQASCAWADRTLTGTVHADSGRRHGLVIADARLKQLNVNVAHSVFTQLHSAGRSLRSLVEPPVFAHSDNHAGLQIADMLASALLFPLATHVLCVGQYPRNLHLRDYTALAARYSPRIADLFGPPTVTGQRARLVVSDALAGRGGAAMG